MKSFVKKFIPSFVLSWYHLGLAVMAAFYYRFPSKKMIIIGATGTNGKSTVVYMISRILEEAGYKIGSLSSIKFKIGDEERPNTLKMTMPGRFKMQKFLHDCLRAGCRYVVIEVTSEGIKQWRHWGIDFDVAVFTNLTPEHIESHGSFDKYKEAKGKLFGNLAKGKKKGVKKISVVNLDGENAEYFAGFEAEEKYGFRIKNQESRIKNTNQKLKIINAENVEIKSFGVNFNIQGVDFSLGLLGKFNIYNALAAVCVGLSQGINLEICKRALEKIKGIPGRMEIVVSEPFTVIVDYAHTPDSLVKAYQTLANLHKLTTNATNTNSKQGRMICILGAAGGGRDKWKRAEFGKIAAKYCDKIILTNEDSYDEKPEKILSDIKSGISNFSEEDLFSIIDRREAIRKALTLAKEDDTIVITGKGNEPWIMGPKGGKIPWDDREVAREEMKKLTRSVIPSETK